MIKQITGRILYHIGDLVSKPMQHFDWAWLYPLYNWCMNKSIDLKAPAWKEEMNDE